MISKVFSAAVSQIRNRPFVIDQSISDSDLIGLSIQHGIGLLRGLVRLRRGVSLGKSVRIHGKHRLRLDSGVTIGDHVVLNAIGREELSIGRSSSVGAFSVLKVSGSLADLGKGIRIGRNVGIGEFAHVGGAGGVEIGDDTIIGPYFSSHPENHVFSASNVAIREQGLTRKGIRVGKGCWIGAKVTLLDGSEVGDYCVVAAGAVVKDIFPSNCVIGGIPARIIRQK